MFSTSMNHSQQIRHFENRIGKNSFDLFAEFENSYTLYVLLSGFLVPHNLCDVCPGQHLCITDPVILTKIWLSEEHLAVYHLLA